MGILNVPLIGLGRRGEDKRGEGRILREMSGEKTKKKKNSSFFLDLRGTFFKMRDLRRIILFSKICGYKTKMHFSPSHAEGET